MFEIMYRLFNNIDSLKAFIVSISSAFFGTLLSVDANAVTTQMQDPVWFCNVKPYFQIGAWSIAMFSGLIGMYVAIRNDRRNRKKNKTK